MFTDEAGSGNVFFYFEAVLQWSTPQDMYEDRKFRSMVVNWEEEAAVTSMHVRITL